MRSRSPDPPRPDTYLDEARGFGKQANTTWSPNLHRRVVICLWRRSRSQISTHRHFVILGPSHREQRPFLPYRAPRVDTSGFRGKPRCRLGFPSTLLVRDWTEGGKGLVWRPNVAKLFVLFSFAYARSTHQHHTPTSRDRERDNRPIDQSRDTASG